MSRILLATLLASAWTLSAQPAGRPSFEVASVKPSAASCTGPRPDNGPTPGRLELPCVPVKALIRAAYATLAGDQVAARGMEIIGGPAWLDTDRYDISAKAAGPASPTQMIGPMLQMLLEERFELKLHVEPRDSPVYSLTVAKNGPKLQAAKEGSCIPLDLNNRELWNGSKAMPCGMPRTTNMAGVTRLDVPGVTMELFAGRALPTFAGRPVVDKTGLSGSYDIHLEFSRDLPTGSVFLNGVPQPAPPTAESAGPSIFTALQEQLGLKLSADKAPVNAIVIDSVQKPAAN